MINLKNILKGKVVILCLGNLDRGDDGVGPVIAAKLSGKTSHEVINAGMTPENFTGPVTKLNPDTIIIIDTVMFDGAPGDYKIFKGDDLREGKISTHDVSPKLLIEYLKSSTKAEIYILGIKPKSNNIGEPLSPEVEKSIDEIVKLLIQS
ncbi:MAG: hydrogenase 3 maturation endopeptidase HyCI [Candidatus Omnitrophota bacterium]